jgi:hypothetical protein
MDRKWAAVPVWLLAVAGCAPGGDSEAEGKDTDTAVQASEVAANGDRVCEVVNASTPLPDEVRESSGLTQSRRDANLFWTHNDAGSDAEVFGVSAEGRLVQRVRITGAQADDWEDVESGMCDGGTCLYLADIGDNNARRERVTIYRVAEPDAGISESAPAVALHVRYPDEPQDAESIFALASGELYIVTKGQHGPIAVYRYPSPHRPNETVTLERVRELFPRPNKDAERATGAAASPDGRWIALRNHDTMYLYRAAELLRAGGSVEPTVVDLKPLDQPQGEAVAFGNDGTVWLSTEAPRKSERATLAQLRCRLPAG